MNFQVWKVKYFLLNAAQSKIPFGQPHIFACSKGRAQFCNVFQALCRLLFVAKKHYNQ
jgi:hypothetical protein